MSTLERALMLAAQAHAEQVDKAGEPYILHPLRMMLRLRGADERIVALLHDVVEDSEVSLDDLRAHGFSPAVIEAVAALTHASGESYEAFIERAGRNPLARRVKLADLEDNCDLSRIREPGPQDHARIEKYRRAIAVLRE